MRKYMSRSKQIIYLCNITMKLHFNLLPNDFKLSPFHSAAHTYCATYTNTPLYPYTPHTIYREFLTVSISTMATAPTWTQVARKKKTPAFLPTECAVNLEQFAAPQRLPPSSSRYSAFVPLPSDYKWDWAMNIVATIPTSAIGIVP